MTTTIIGGSTVGEHEEGLEPFVPLMPLSATMLPEAESPHTTCAPAFCPSTIQAVAVILARGVACVAARGAGSAGGKPEHWKVAPASAMILNPSKDLRKRRLSAAGHCNQRIHNNFSESGVRYKYRYAIFLWLHMHLPVLLPAVRPPRLSLSCCHTHETLKSGACLFVVNGGQAGADR